MGKTWSYAIGSKGTRVCVYERTPGGILYLRAWDTTKQGGAGAAVRLSLKHRDRKAAKTEAQRIAGLLAQGNTLPRVLNLGALLDQYRHLVVAEMKPRTAKWVGQMLSLWETFLGRETSVSAIGGTEWEAFKRARSSGAIDGTGLQVAPDARRPVTPGTVNLALDALRMACNWALAHRLPHGTPLLDRSPIARLKDMDDVNPVRSFWTYDRFQVVIAAAAKLQMQVEWHGKRQMVPCPLAAVLVIKEATGRRIHAVRQLRPCDLHLNAAPHGAIAWPADTDKGGKHWLTPITAELREYLVGMLRARQSLGDTAPLFPAPRNPTQPISWDTLALYLRRALVLAGLPRLPREAFHGLRRKWVIERKHLPDADVAQAGGWRSVNVMKRSYQLADEPGVLRAVEEPRRLYSKGAS